MMTAGLMTQDSNVSPTLRARGENPSTPRVNCTVARRRALAAADSEVRVAALLSAISRNNRYEGRDPAVIPDCTTSGFVADLLGLKIADLANALVKLEHLGLVQAQGSTLRLTELTALEKFIESD
jgi:hypothetical protein